MVKTDPFNYRLGYQDVNLKGRNLIYFNTVQGALDYADDRNSANSTTGSMSGSCSNHSGDGGAANPAAAAPSAAGNTGQTQVGGGGGGNGALIFLHGGTYRGEFLVIDSDIALIGAAPGNVAESVILERESESTVMFVEGAKNAYAGHLTLKFSPDVTSTVPHHKHYCLEVGENCSPTIDHCIIRSTSVGK